MEVKFKKTYGKFLLKSRNCCKKFFARLWKNSPASEASGLRSPTERPPSEAWPAGRDVLKIIRLVKAFNAFGEINTFQIHHRN